MMSVGIFSGDHFTPVAAASISGHGASVARKIARNALERLNPRAVMIGSGRAPPMGQRWIEDAWRRSLRIDAGRAANYSHCAPRPVSDCARRQ
jgi:hypothetical protein